MSYLELPSEVTAHSYAPRLTVALRACTSAGAALLELRGQPIASQDLGEQLKTSVDQAAEGWVLGLLRATFPDDLFLAEEAYDTDGNWHSESRPYWTVDALDGTRSFVDGYDGFCVQVAYVVDGEPCVGVVFEPVTRAAFVGIANAGSWRLDPGGTTRLRVAHTTDKWSAEPRFIDSIPPDGAAGRLMHDLSAVFVECGSVGLKICRVAEGRADIFCKHFRYKLWDIAPGAVILKEAGGLIGTWQSRAINYLGTDIVHTSLLATPAAVWEATRAQVSSYPDPG